MICGSEARWLGWENQSTFWSPGHPFCTINLASRAVWCLGLSVSVFMMGVNQLPHSTHRTNAIGAHAAMGTTLAHECLSTRRVLFDKLTPTNRSHWSPVTAYSTERGEIQVDPPTTMSIARGKRGFPTDIVDSA